MTGERVTRQRDRHRTVLSESRSSDPTSKNRAKPTLGGALDRIVSFEKNGPAAVFPLPHGAVRSLATTQDSAPSGLGRWPCLSLAYFMDTPAIRQKHVFCAAGNALLHHARESR